MSETSELERLAFLAEASAILFGSRDTEEALQRLARLTVTFLGDLCLIDLLAKDGSIRRVAAVHADPAFQPLADRLRQEFGPDPQGPHPAVGVMRSGRSEASAEMSDEFLRKTTRNDEHHRIVREMGFQSFMSVPLLAPAGILGAFTIVSTDPDRRYGNQDLELAESLARRAVMAVDNARLYEAERRARAEAESARERLAFLAAVGQALTASLDYDTVMERMVRLAVPTIADICVIDIAEDDDTMKRVAAAHSEEEVPDLMRALRGHPPDPRLPHPVNDAVRTGEPQLLPEVPPGVVEAMVGPARELRDGFAPFSLMVVPLIARGRTLGAISFISVDPARRFGAEDVDVGQELARRAAVALDNARLYRQQRHIAATLQRSLLPKSLPVIAGMELAARYQAAGEGTEVGGDFYDVFGTARGDWVLVIGDVCGKGVEAAAVTGLARYTLRATAPREGRPSRILAMLNDALLDQVERYQFCTVCCARLRVGDGRARLTVSCGGHPLPMLLRTDGSVERAGGPGTLLGIFPDPSLADHVADLGPGDVLLLFTDGLIEARRAGTAFGEQRLASVLASCAGLNAEAIAGRVERAVLEFQDADSLRDDLALMVARVAPSQR